MTLHPLPVEIPDEFLKTDDDTHIETIFSTFACGTRTAVAGCVYCPPRSPVVYMVVLCDLLGYLHETLPPHYVFFLMGDFNLLINWTNPNPRTVHLQLFNDTVLGPGLQQTVTTPSRGDNLFDLVFINGHRYLPDIHTRDNLPGCDHFAVSGTLNVPRPFVILKYKDLSPGNLIATVGYTPWEMAFSSTSIDETWKLWLDIFWACVKDNFPYVAIRGKKRSPWITGELVHDSKKTMSDSDWKRYKDFSNALRRKTSEAYLEFRSLEISASAPIVFKVQDRQLSCPLAIATAFGDFFYRSFTKPDPDLTLTTLGVCANSFSIDSSDVASALKRMKTGSTCGPDGITPRLLQLMSPAIIDPLAKLFNLPLATSSLPSAWKLASVVPVYKGSGKRNEIRNYRPISLTSVVGKLLESIIYEKVNQYLEDNSVIPASQYGFRQGLLCTHQLLHSFHEWSTILDERNPPDVHVVSFEWAKAFDSVCHQRLLFKMNRAGISGALLECIRDFYTIVFNVSCIAVN